MEGIHPLSDKEVEADLPMCSPSQVNTAIRDYQIKYKLPVSGILDDVTRKFMSTSRCGNADKDAISAHALPEVMEESTENLYNSNFKTSNVEPVNRRRWRRNAGNTKLINVLTSETVKNQNILRRTKYIKRYAEKYKHELLKPYTVEERQKRSIIANIVVKNNSLKGEPVWDGQKFTKDYIRWRMLRDGFSTRIPVEEQRASLRLAFRMWSEVIPIIFEEDLTGDINRVDIEIAFGRGIDIYQHQLLIIFFFYSFIYCPNRCQSLIFRFKIICCIGGTYKVLKTYTFVLLKHVVFEVNYLHNVLAVANTCDLYALHTINPFKAMHPFYPLLRKCNVNIS